MAEKKKQDKKKSGGQHLLERRGKEYFSELAKKRGAQLKGNSEYMRELVNKRWAKERIDKGEE